jgi:TrbL/VirB6 plasmid conjugal transfer protein
MRKLLPYLGLITILLVGAGAFAMPQITNAALPDAILNVMGWSTDVVYGLLGKLLWWAAVPATGLVVQLIGSMIDLVISISSDTTFYNSDAIKSSWAILRDVANMTFIFILIFNGLQVILNRGNLATIKKVLGGVILAAVFINFSLFFTKAVIDVSNITAAWFIQGIYGVAGTTSVSDAIHGTFQMSKLAESPTNQITSANFSSQAFATGLIMVVLNCIVIYVFFQLLFILLARLVTFIVLLITAPIGFVGLLLPQLKSYAEKWWKELNSQAMLAPMLFLMLYIILYIVDQTNDLFFTKGGGAVTDSFTGSSFSSGNYVMFAIIIALLFKVLDVAKEYSGELGGQISNVLKSGVMFATGTMAMGTIGKAAHLAQNSAGFQKFVANNGVLGKTLMAGVKGTADSGFGITSNLKNLGVGKMPGMKNAFKGADKGYSGKASQEEKDEKEYAKLLGKGLAGAQNRQAYAANLQSGLYGRVTQGVGTGLNLVTLGGAGKVADKIRNSETAKAASAMANKVTERVSEIANKTAAGRFVYNTAANIGSAASNMTENIGLKNAKGGVSKDADKEYVKEAGEAARKEKEKKIDNDPEVKAMEEEAKKIKEEIDAAGEEAKNFINKPTKDIERLENKEKDAIAVLQTYDSEASTIGGVFVDREQFERRRDAAQQNIASARNEIISKRNELESKEDSQDTVAQELLTRQLNNNEALKSKKGELAKKTAETLRGMGVDVKGDTLEAIQSVIDAGKNKKAEEESEKLKKIVENGLKEPEEKKPEGGDGGKKDEGKDKK